MKKAFIVFLRIPVSGKVKTRLQKDLGSERTLRIYKSFISDTLKMSDGLKGVDKFLGCFPTVEEPYVQRLVKKHRLRAFPQRGKDLGEKFINAFHNCFNEGYRRVVIIGSDSPTVPLAHIRQAFKELDRYDFVLGPCTDGGYYLVGAKERIPEMAFRGIPWDSPEVLNTTLDKLSNGRVRLSLLPFWYDVDTVEDFEFYRRHVRYLKDKMDD